MAETLTKREKKANAIERIYELFGTHKQIILVNFTNVGSNQVQQIRKTLRAFNGQLVISKNTLIKKILQMRTEGIKDEEFKHLEAQFGGLIPELRTLVPLLKDKVALIFCDAPVFEIKNKVESNKLPTEARIGVVAPVDFTVPAGPTGLDPSQINFFHALNISTKIVKGQIEITKDFRVTTIGKKVRASEAALLKKLNLKPFFYGMTVNSVYDEGSILPKEVLEINPDQFLEKFASGVRNIAALSLEAGYPVEATIPLIISNSFRNIAALSMESGYKIKELSAATVKAEKPKQEKKKEEKKEPKKKEPEPEPPKEEEEEDIGLGGLF